MGTSRTLNSWRTLKCFEGRGVPHGRLAKRTLKKEAVYSAADAVEGSLRARHKLAQALRAVLRGDEHRFEMLQHRARGARRQHPERRPDLADQNTALNDDMLFR